ncbi:hypothetical protein JK358_28935 [Nocardia sp. 2]|uniref:DUF2973 domain-containing protein n=1 Tax=Nocardia acididurans TaxID=2802282 RepID=A0ABS1MDU3_9NOCA|nr:DUF6191 domain-containing protein [Nocardia acididurans]MBL1078439.1 hypothetical protein [Nocardia acididurans]
MSFLYWLLLLLAVAIFINRLIAWAESRGWIPARPETPPTGGGGVAGLLLDLQALTAPSAQHTAEERRSKDMQGEQLSTGADPFGVDIDAGVVHLRKPPPSDE